MPKTRMNRFGPFLILLAAASIFVWLQMGPPAPGKAFGIFSPSALLVLLGLAYLLFWALYFAISRQPNRSKAINFSLATFSIGMCLALLELPAMAGLLNYSRLISPPQSAQFTRIKPWMDPNNRLDRELVHLRQPGLKIQGETTGDLVYWLQIENGQTYPIDARYDQNGFRNEREINQADIAVIGDSFVEAGLVPSEQLFTTLLAQHLNVEVANLGQSGYGPQQELVVLRRFGLELQPKVVMWLFFEGNDLLDVKRYEDQMKDWERTIQQMDSFKTRSLTKNTLDLIVALTEPQPQASGEKAEQRSCKVAGGPEEAGQVLYFAYVGAPLHAEDLASLEKAQQVLLEAQALSAENGTRFVLAFVPTKYRVYSDLCEFPPESLAASWQVNDLPQRLERWASDNGIPFLDLTVPLKEAAQAGQLVYYTDDGHWNGAGNQAAARMAAAQIQARGWLDSIPVTLSR